MNTKKQLSILALSAFIGFNLNSGAEQHISKDLELIKKVIEADKEFKNRWLDFKLNHCSETIHFIKRHYDEALSRTNEYINKLAKASSEENSEKITHELLESMLNHSKEHFKKAHELYQSLHKKAHEIYHEELRRFEELSKEVRHDKLHTRRHEEKEERSHREKRARLVAEECEPAEVEQYCE